MTIIIREFIPEKDTGLIYDSWPKSAFALANYEIKENQQTWFKNFFTHMQESLKNCQVFIACLDQSPDTIIGYCVIDGDSLEWLYVKPDFRNQGVENLLIKDKGLKEVAIRTNFGTHLAKKHNLREKYQ